MNLSVFLGAGNVNVGRVWFDLVGLFFFVVFFLAGAKAS